ncbi:MAG: hypothetical protein ATN36_01815 [Epulopiscium sp. Nele67-Bin005]|nr:MAG: hypothetical protein ATN36_01815 [Epulopiscium sp. Nele67-Bin005]
MKLRQKLAMVLAAALLVTNVPVVTNAVSWNYTQNVVAGNTYTNTLAIEFNSLFNNGGTNADQIPVTTTGALQIVNDGYAINVSGDDLDFDWEKIFIDATGGSTSGIENLYNANNIGVFGVDSANPSNFITVEGLGWSTVKSWVDSSSSRYLVFHGLGDVMESTGLPVDHNYYQHGQISIAYNGDSDEMLVYIAKNTGNIYGNDHISIPLYYIADTGNPRVTVHTRVDALPITGNTISVSASDAVTEDPFYFDIGNYGKVLSVDGGHLDDMTLEEKSTGALVSSLGAVTSYTDRYDIKGNKYSSYYNSGYADEFEYVELIKFELKTSGLEFRYGSVELEGNYGFTNAMFERYNGSNYDSHTYVVVEDEDTVQILIRHSALNDEIYNRNGQRGDIVISGLGVYPEGRNDGEDGTVVKIRVTSDYLDTSTYEVATLSDFAAVLICDDPVDIISGKEDEWVTVELNELVPKVINVGDEITFELSKGFIGKVQQVYNSSYSKVSWENITFADALIDSSRNGGGIIIDPLHDTDIFGHETIVQMETAISSYSYDWGLPTLDDLIELPDELMLVDFNIDEDGFIIGFDVVATASFDSVSDPEEMEIGFNLGGRLGEEGNVYLTAINRGFDEDLIVKVGELNAPVIAVAEHTVILEAGMRMQAGGKIVITEEYEGMFEKVGNNKFTIAIEQHGTDDGIRIEDATVTIDGFSANYTISDGAIVIEVIRESDGDLGSVTIEDIVFTSTNVTPQGQYGVEIYGDAINDHAALARGDDSYSGGVDHEGAGSIDGLYSLVLEDFIQVGTDVRTNAVETTINWRTGATTVNGEKVDLLVQPFVSENGRTMVGIRDIATFFNIPPQQIQFFNQPVDGYIYGQPVSQGTGIVQIINGDTIVTFVNGSNIAIAGSQTLYMDEVMQIVDERSYAPIRYVGEALGLTVTVDEATTTATFKNTAN